MKKKVLNVSRRSLALTLALALVVGIVFMIPTLAADTSDLGQLIDSFTANSSTFTLNSTSRFFLAEEPTDEVKNVVQLAQSQFDADNLPAADVKLDIVWGKTEWVRAGDILIKMADSSDTTFGAEGYKLEVTTFATVTAKDVRGLMYGLNMLQKHFRNAGSNTIKGFTAIDTPDTKERTVQLDCARKYLSVDYICNFVKEMAWMGYNSLQLHFSEDGGFRADFWDPAYYKGVFQPQNDFSWLCGSATQYWCYSYKSYDGTVVNYANDPDAGRFLKTSELKQIVDVCKTYNIDIIPSFDSPAHMDYLTWKFEKYHASTTDGFTFKYGETTYSSNANGVNGIINYYGTGGASKPDGRRYTTIDVSDTLRGQTAQAFVLSIYKDIADFFKEYAGSTKFNIGADEVVLDNNTSWQYDQFTPYINKVNALLESRGYKCRMFNDFITASALEDLDDDIEILYWNTPFNTTASSSSVATNYYKVNYKYNSDGSVSRSAMQTVANFTADNRTVYNCVNQHTYYVLRVNNNTNGGDARSKSCRTWEFYGSDEESIYNKWAPNNISKKGDLEEPDVIVSSNSLGGAYFLTWHDYAAVNTETAVWNGVLDFMKNTKEFYSLRYRMWSNSIKMWNWDINSSLSFDAYKTLRNTLGDFPGLQSDTYDGTYAKATSLPEPTEPKALADHTELAEALLNKIAQGDYTDASYNAYLTAYNKAVEVNANNAASAAEIGQALTDLNTAKKNLTVKTNSFTVKLMTTLNNTSHEIKSTTYAVPISETTFDLFISAMNGYEYIRVESSDENVTATFTPSASGDGSGYLSGPAVSDVTYTIWYENNVDTSRLDDLVEEAIMEQGDFTHASWVTYTTVLSKARNFSLTATTTQDDVDALVKSLEDARTALIIDSDVTTITIEKINGTFLVDGQIGLHVYTTPNVASLTVTNKETGKVQTLDYCSGEVQELNDGKVVKYWLVFFPAGDTAGTFTYTVSYRTTSDEVTVTVG